MVLTALEIFSSPLFVSHGITHELDTYSSINDDILPAKEESSLSRICPMRYLLEEQSIVRPIKVLLRQYLSRHRPTL